MTQELKMTVLKGREQRDQLVLEVDRLKQASNVISYQSEDGSTQEYHLDGGRGWSLPVLPTALNPLVVLVHTVHHELDDLGFDPQLVMHIHAAHCTTVFSFCFCPLDRKFFYGTRKKVDGARVAEYICMILSIIISNKIKNINSL